MSNYQRTIGALAWAHVIIYLSTNGLRARAGARERTSLSELLSPTRGDLIRAQEHLASARPEPWRWSGSAAKLGGVFVAFARRSSGPGAAGDLCWAAATTFVDGKLHAFKVVASHAEAPYEPGMLFLRSGRPMLEAVQQLPERPDVLLVNATGRDHPRSAGLAIHLGALLDVPTVGVTHRPLVASGDWPADERDASTPLVLNGEVVGFWLRTRAGVRPLAVHAGWRTDPATALEVVKACLGTSRTPEPLRLAREYARKARTATVS